MLKRSLLLFLIVATFATFSHAMMRGFESSKESLVKIGESVVVPEGAEVKSVVSIGGSVTVFGKVSDDVVSVGGSVFLKDNSSVGGDVVSVGGKVIKEPAAVAKGDIVEVGMPGISPTVSFFTKGGVLQGILLFRLMAFVGFLVLAAILVALFTPQLGRQSAVIEADVMSNFWVGLVTILLFGPVIFMLLVSIVGIVMIPLWILVYVLAGIFGYVAAGHLLGKKILIAAKISGKSMMVETLIGVTFFWLVGLVPFIGFMVKVFAVICGLGAAYQTRFGTR
jgi:hypothetical protein